MYSLFLHALLILFKDVYLIPVGYGSCWANFIFTLVTFSPLSFAILLSYMVFLLIGYDVTSRLWSMEVQRGVDGWIYKKREWRRPGKTKAIFDNRPCPAGLRWRRALTNLRWTELVALQVDSKPHIFSLPGASSNVGVLAGYGKEMQDISFACSTYITGVMGDV